MSDPPVIPDQHRELLAGPHTAVLVTLGPDGRPHASPVWYLLDGSEVVVSTRSGSQKHRNVARDERVSLTVYDPAQPMHYVEIRGNATVFDDPNCTSRDRIVAKHGYLDGSAFDRPGAQRITIVITPERILGR